MKDNAKIKNVIKQYFTDTTSKTICNLMVLNIMFKMLKNDTNYTSMFDKLTSYNNTDGKYCIQPYRTALMAIFDGFNVYLQNRIALNLNQTLFMLVLLINIFINNRRNTFPFRLCFAKRGRRWGYPVLGSSIRRQAGHILDSRQVESVLLY